MPIFGLPFELYPLRRDTTIPIITGLLLLIILLVDGYALVRW